mmetsp:Transcript_39450/g.91522  ORF Transcript_39450/g.91522 Transcript_39450/m.91522 type:complete len:322 (-) Transcript_39450:237-1202(-)
MPPPWRSPMRSISSHSSTRWQGVPSFAPSSIGCLLLTQRTGPWRGGCARCWQTSRSARTRVSTSPCRTPCRRKSSGSRSSSAKGRRAATTRTSPSHLHLQCQRLFGRRRSGRVPRATWTPGLRRLVLMLSVEDPQRTSCPSPRPTVSLQQDLLPPCHSGPQQHQWAQRTCLTSSVQAPASPQRRPQRRPKPAPLPQVRTGATSAVSARRQWQHHSLRQCKHPASACWASHWRFPTPVRPRRAPLRRQCHAARCVSTTLPTSRGHHPLRHREGPAMRRRWGFHTVPHWALPQQGLRHQRVLRRACHRSVPPRWTQQWEGRPR